MSAGRVGAPVLPVLEFSLLGMIANVLAGGYQHKFRPPASRPDDGTSSLAQQTEQFVIRDFKRQHRDSRGFDQCETAGPAGDQFE